MAAEGSQESLRGISKKSSNSHPNSHGSLRRIPEENPNRSEDSLASVGVLSDTDSEDCDDGDRIRVPKVTLNGTDPKELDGWGLSALQSAGYMLGRFVGGSVAAISVRHVACTADLDRFAAKDATGATVSVRRSVCAEYKLLRSIVHPSVVKVKHLFTTKHDVWLLREWCHDGCSWSYVATHGAFEEMHGIALVEQLVEGLFYLHQKGLLHRSIEPGNLLLTNNVWTLKIAGFSKLTMLSELEEDPAVSKEAAPAAARRRLQELTCINSAWASPEHIQDLAEDSRSDVWSCGLCAGFFLAGRHPFTSPASTVATPGTQLKRASLLKRVSVALLEGMSFGSKAFIKACLQPNPAKRPWSMELRLHPVLMMRSRGEKVDDAITAASGRFYAKTLGALDELDEITDTQTDNRPNIGYRQQTDVRQARERHAFHTMHVLPEMRSYEQGLLPGCGLLSSGSDTHPPSGPRPETVVADRSVSKNVAAMQSQWRKHSQYTSFTLNPLPAYTGMDAPRIQEARAQVAKAVPSYSTLDTLPLLEVSAGQSESDHSTWNRRVVSVMKDDVQSPHCSAQSPHCSADTAEASQMKEKKPRGNFGSCHL